MTSGDTRRRFLFGAGGAAAGFAAGQLTAHGDTVKLGGPESETRLLRRRLSGGDGRPVVNGANSLLVLSQVRNGRTVGDAVLLIRDESMKAPYKEQSYFTDHGAYESGRWIVISQKRVVDSKGPRIQGVSSLADGAEPFMIAASTDIDGPSFAGEAWTQKTKGHRNCSAFAAYDLDDVHSGRGSYSPGYGRKRFVIRGDGGLWWGPDLADDPWKRADVRLERGGPGHLRVSAPRDGQAAVLEVAAREGSTAIVRMSAGRGQVDLVADGGRGLTFATGQGRDSSCGVEPGGALRDRVQRERPGPPRSGRWSAGACVVNLVDDRVYWCVEAGSPGGWRSAQLR